VAKKTNKTSHVLNLITNGTASETEQESSSQKPPVGGASFPQNPADSNAAGEHAAALRENAEALRVSAAALREATLSEEAETQKSPDNKDDTTKEAPVRPPSSGDKKVIVVNKSSDNDKLSTEIMNNLTAHLEEEAAKQEVFHMLNVMEQIVGHIDLEQHMKNYDLCMCQRCRVDVLALTLTRLPAKYVVVGEYSVAPIIGYYENRFRVRILTEIIKSCLDVKANPRHGSPGTVQSIKK